MNDWTPNASTRATEASTGAHLLPRHVSSLITGDAEPREISSYGAFRATDADQRAKYPEIRQIAERVSIWPAGQIAR